MAHRRRRALRATTTTLLRAGMTTLDRVSPATTGRVAERLWSRVPVTPRPDARNARTPEGGRPFAVAVGGVRIAGAEYGPADAPIAYLVHGWGGWWQQLAAHVPGLLASGYRIVAYDAPCHGDSAHGRHGRGTSSLMEVAEAYTGVVGHFGPAGLVVGHSMGAMAAMWAITRHDVLADGYAFIGAAAAAEPMVTSFAGLVGMGEASRAEMVRRVESRAGMRLADLRILADLGRRGAGAGLPPMMAVHDADDHEAPLAEIEELTAAWPGSELTITRGLGHRRVIWSEPTLGLVRDFASRLRREPR